MRAPLAGAFVIAAGGMTLLAHVGEHGSYARDVLPGMLVAGLGLGVAIVSVSIAILTGARAEETGMISGLSATSHEIGGTIGIAVFSTIAAGAGILAGPHAASGIAHAFVAAALLAAVASLVALAVLPTARHFVPKLRLNPQRDARSLTRARATREHHRWGRRAVRAQAAPLTRYLDPRCGRSGRRRPPPSGPTGRRSACSGRRPRSCRRPSGPPCWRTP